MEKNVNMEMAAAGLEPCDHKFDILFDLSPMAIVLSEFGSGALVDVNERFLGLTLYDREELIGKTTTGLGFFTPEDRKHFIQTLAKQGEVRHFEMNLRIKDGSTLNTLVFARILGAGDDPHILSIVQDRSDEKRLRQKFLQAQKMEFVGTLAAGIAHDLNNYLLGIEGNVTLLKLDMNDSHPCSTMLQEIHGYVEGCTQLTQQLLGYARKGQHKIGRLDLNRLISETSDAFRRSHKRIHVTTCLAQDLETVAGDANQIRQILFNLYFNAADAMPEGGELRLQSANISHENMAGRSYSPKRKNYVSITVKDTGSGMDQYILDHLFEPFFTTKETGRGTGLGLASVYGLVKGHDGYIHVESEPDMGTTFRLYFPASGSPYRGECNNLS